MNNYENIRLDKSLYNAPGGFSRALEALDPSSEYRDTSLSGLDAFGRQLKRFDIKISGPESDCVEKFFRTSESSALFPEYVSRAVRRGMDEEDVIPDIVAATTLINGLDYRSLASVISGEDRELAVVGEGAFIPQTEINVSESLVSLKKRGRMLVASYEAIKFQRLDVFTVTLRQIGAYIARTQLGDAVDIIINGTGENDEADVIYTATAGEVVYTDLINLWSALSPYKLTTLLVSPDAAQKLLALDEMSDAQAGLTFHGTGKMITPLGAELICSSRVPENTIIGLDKDYALERVQSGEVTTEYDRLIDRQLERAAITCTAGFSKLFTDAAVVLSLASQDE